MLLEKNKGAWVALLYLELGTCKSHRLRILMMDGIDYIIRVYCIDLYSIGCSAALYIMHVNITLQVINQQG